MLQYLLLHEYDAVWDRFVGSNIVPSVKNEAKYLTDPGNIYVLNVNFYDLKPNGAIRITNSDDKSLLTSDSFFCDSQSSHQGGSISVNNGKCIQYHVCSINSSLFSSSGCHSYVATKKENFVIESSISQCKGYESVLYIYNGNQIIDSTNISHSKCDVNGACVCVGSSTYHMINFTSIFNNSAAGQCIMWHSGNSHYISKCKIINNKLNKNQNGLISNYGSDLTVSDSIFSLNFGPALFSNPAKKKFLVDKCYIDSNNDFVRTVTYSVSLTTTNYLDFNLPHLSTKKCIAEFPIKIKNNQNTIVHIHAPFGIIIVFIYIPVNSLS